MRTATNLSLDNSDQNPLILVAKTIIWTIKAAKAERQRADSNLALFSSDPLLYPLHHSSPTSSNKQLLNAKAIENPTFVRLKLSYMQEWGRDNFLFVLLRCLSTVSTYRWDSLLDRIQSHTGCSTSTVRSNHHLQNFKNGFRSLWLRCSSRPHDVTNSSSPYRS